MSSLIKYAKSAAFDDEPYSVAQAFPPVNLSYRSMSITPAAGRATAYRVRALQLDCTDQQTAVRGPPLFPAFPVMYIWFLPTVPLWR